MAAVVPGGGGDDGLELGVNLPVSCAGLGSNFTVLEWETLQMSFFTRSRSIQKDLFPARPFQYNFAIMAIINEKHRALS